MKLFLTKRSPRLLLMLPALLISSCAPGPPPPIPPGLAGAGFGWLIIALLVWIAILLWRIHSTSRSKKADQLVHSLNSINERLCNLEEKIKEMKQEKTRSKRRTS